jgi:glucan biosynthesis protein
MTIKDELTDLAALRHARAEITQQIDIAEQALHNTQEYKRLAALRETCKTYTDEEDAAASRARSLALVAYETRGNKHPAPGIQIKLYRQVLYDQATALAWCSTDAPFLVQHTINARAFERLAPEIPGAPVQVVSQARAIIDADLTQYTAQPAPNTEEQS